MTAIWVPVSMQHSPSFFFLFKKAFIFEANDRMTPGKKYPRTGIATIQQLRHETAIAQADLSYTKCGVFLAGNSSNNHKGIVVLNYFNILCMKGAIGEFSI
ncbi:hypothetical protein AADC60_10110 [Cytobacillus pseudoceanisediminis]|nr:hypothetical protein [Cytobacillus oceanisediminis]MBY0157352.1 hypothetical protein [Cytobacillus firmus]MCM3527941.1 hypothetical protein [Cytobacillus oceanisediminis]QOK27989.1 hypothetical protein IIE26_04780 [Cytobacillus oceanisediminis]